MEEIWSQINGWVESEEPFALATVVQVKQSSPRGVGACLAISADGKRFIGSVSAGCVENEVIEAAKTCVKDGEARRLVFGPTHGYPWEVGLTCGGTIIVRVEPFPGLGDALSSLVREAIEKRKRSVLASGNKGHFLVDREGDASFGQKLPIEVEERARDLLDQRGAAVELEVAGQFYFLRPLGMVRKLYIVGAGHIATHLVALGRSLLYDTIVIDPREAYARTERFPVLPDRIIIGWPEVELANAEIREGDSVAVLSHDSKIDDQALEVFLKSPASYIGALGSRKSHAARLKRLKEKGFAEEALARIKAPIGLDIGGATPAEIAVSVAAELIHERSQG